MYKGIGDKRIINMVTNCKENNMIIAIPVSNNKLCAHFGHCEKFVFFNIDETTKKIIHEKELIPPPHEPGIIPVWISEQGGQVIIAGGIGQRAQELFKKFNVKVIFGMAEEEPRKIIYDFLNNTLKIGQNICDH
jgi:predicted Fe-Mo cluster-binding NifX family protein